MTLLKPLLTLVLLFQMLNAYANFDQITEQRLRASIEGEHRTEGEKQRDQYRKPLKTLEFLGFRSDMTVVEIWPGAGWYTKILAPALQRDGLFYAAMHDLNGAYGYQRRGNGKLLSILGAAPKLYGDARVSEFGLPYKLAIAPAESADMVLTFRNVHNLVMDLYGGGKYASLGFDAMFKALKPGGILGVVDHKWDDPSTENALSENGYISVERTVELAKSAGFILLEESDILANTADTKDYEKGVWTLPPSYALGDKDREKYSAIGESDRFLLKFQKPEKK